MNILRILQCRPNARISKHRLLKKSYDWNGLINGIKHSHGTFCWWLTFLLIEIWTIKFTLTHKLLLAIWNRIPDDKPAFIAPPIVRYAFMKLKGHVPDSSQTMLSPAPHPRDRQGEIALVTECSQACLSGHCPVNTRRCSDVGLILRRRRRRANISPTFGQWYHTRIPRAKPALVKLIGMSTSQMLISQHWHKSRLVDLNRRRLIGRNRYPCQSDFTMRSTCQCWVNVGPAPQTVCQH